MIAVTPETTETKPEEAKPTEALAVMSIEEEVSKGYAVLKITDAKLENMLKKSQELEIKGVDDKEGYKKVKDAELIVKNFKSETEKLRVALKEPVLAKGRAIDDEAKRIKGKLDIIETNLKTKREKVDNALRIQEEERAKAELARINTRTSQVNLSGVVFDGYAYRFNHLSINTDQIKAMTDEQFSKFATDLKAEIELEQKKIQEAEEKKRQEEIELDRKRKELDERERAIAEREKLLNVAQEQATPPETLEQQINIVPETEIDLTPEKNMVKNFVFTLEGIAYPVVPNLTAANDHIEKLKAGVSKYIKLLREEYTK